ncbi:thioredoxin [Candidatus Woesearchaeota archaeon]|nr:thioredoxin [Candidatus Woesearchaeota archaeon]
MQELTPESFESTLKEGKSVVDFWAPWCGPCRMFAPIFEEVSKEITDVTFAKVNTQDHQELAQMANVMSIPTIIFMKDGKEVTRLVGALPKDAFTAKVKEIFQ